MGQCGVNTIDDTEIVDLDQFTEHSNIRDVLELCPHTDTCVRHKHVYTTIHVDSLIDHALTILGACHIPNDRNSSAPQASTPIRDLVKRCLATGQQRQLGPVPRKCLRKRRTKS